MVNRVFKSSDALARGRLRRFNLRHALDDLTAEFSDAVNKKPQIGSCLDTIKEEIMQELEECDNGVISKSDLNDAVEAVARKHGG